MSYLGKEIEYTSFVTDTFSGDGTTTQFTLTSAPASSSGIIVNVGGVLQEPEYAYTVSGVTLILSEASPAGTNNINVIHLGVRTDIGQPSAGSIGQNELATSLTNFTHDSFVGDGTIVAFTLSQIAASATALIVFIDGVMQEPTAAYTVSGTTLTFTEAPGNTTDINVIHLGIIKSIGTPSAGTVGVNELAISQYGGEYVKLTDTKATTVNGGASVVGTQTRDLTTKDVDTGNICTLNVPSKQFTLPAGTYRIKASVPAYFVNKHKGFLYNVSDSVNEIIGTSEYATDAATDNSQNSSAIKGSFTIASSKTFEIRHYTQIIKTVDGLGIATSDGTAEVYTVVEIWKVK